MTSSIAGDDRGDLPLPEWISERLIVETQQVWSPRYGHALTTEEALEILLAFGRLVDAL